VNQRNRVFSLPYLLPFALAALAIMHLRHFTYMEGSYGFRYRNHQSERKTRPPTKYLRYYMA
jgi:quinol-cytochrome oxidoreductase complex cytochrome b subunit